MRSVKFIALLCILATATAERGFADEEFSLVINPFTGAAELRNDGPVDVELDSYYITSPADPLLDPVAWTSLSDGAISGWTETFSDTGNRLGELNLFESLSVPAGSSVSIGNPYSVFTPAEFADVEPGLRSLSFEYTLANESSSRRGDVEFSARNTVVLVVDPTSGESMIQNQSPFAIEIDGYIVKSPAEALNVDGWVPLAGSSPNWFSSNGAANRVAEANLTSETPLAAGGGMLTIGAPIDPALLSDERDLVLEFTTSNSPSIVGGILFGSLSPGNALDCNSDGAVDILDANCTPNSELDALLAGLNPPSLRGDGNGSGTVDFNDFLIVSANFNQSGVFTEGDFDKDGMVGFSDFLIVSGSFNQSGVAAAVPEPNALALLGIGGLVLAARRKRVGTRKSHSRNRRM